MVTKRKRVDIPDIEALLRKLRIKQKDQVIKALESLPVRQKSPPPPEGGISINQAARKYGLHSRTLSRWVAKGKIPIILPTKNWLYINEKALITFLKEKNRYGGTSYGE